MLKWMPREVPPSTVPNPEPRERFFALRAIFNWAYLTLPGWVWALPPRQQSEALMRAVIEVSRSYRAPCKGLDYMATDPDTHLGEFLAISALANLGTDTEAFLRELHDIPDDEFPAALYDPAGRRGRPPTH